MLRFARSSLSARPSFLDTPATLRCRYFTLSIHSAGGSMQADFGKLNPRNSGVRSFTSSWTFGQPHCKAALSTQYRAFSALLVFTCTKVELCLSRQGRAERSPPSPSFSTRRPSPSSPSPSPTFSALTTHSTTHSTYNSSRWSPPPVLPPRLPLAHSTDAFPFPQLAPALSCVLLPSITLSFNLTPLQFPVSRVKRNLRRGRYSQRMSSGTSGALSTHRSLPPSPF